MAYVPLLAQVSPVEGCITEESKMICIWIRNLCKSELRYEALGQLALHRDVPDLGLMLWHAFGAVSALLQEITASYAGLLSNEENWLNSNRVCCAITLFQSIAAHPEARIPFLRSEIMQFLLPMLKNATVQTVSLEYVRLSVLGVIGDLVKVPSEEVINYLLGPGQIMPQILRILELSSEMSKAITAYILWRILDHDVGLQYFTANKTTCFHLIYTMAKVVHQLTLEPEPRILKSIVSSYKRLTDDKLALQLLQNHLPEQLRNDYFCNQYSVSSEIQAELRDLNCRINYGMTFAEDSSTGQDGDCSSTSSGSSIY